MQLVEPSLSAILALDLWIEEKVRKRDNGDKSMTASRIHKLSMKVL